MQVDVRRADDLIPQVRYLLYRLERSSAEVEVLDIIRSSDSVDLTRYICVLSNFKVFLYFVVFEVTFKGFFIPSRWNLETSPRRQRSLNKR